MRGSQWGVWSVLVCVGLACRDAPLQCRFGAEHGLFRSEAQTVHELHVVPFSGRLLALFGDSAGVHAQWLHGHGAPIGPPSRVLPACEGGFDAAAGRGELHVACARRAAAPDSPGNVTWYVLDPVLRARAEDTFGRVGRLSEGVAVLNLPGGPAFVWHDAALDGARIWYFEPKGMAAPRLLSDAAWEASAPGLVARGARLHAVWAETRYDGERSRSRILLADPRSKATGRVLLETRDPAPSPQLADTRAGLLLSFRDRREAGRKAGLYLTRVSDERRRRGRVVRAGRADGRASPVLAACLGGVVSATPRTFAGDYFVGVLSADTELRRLSAEQQFYEDSREFDRVAVACAGRAAVLLIAERGKLLRGTAAVRSTTFMCR